MWKTFAGRCIYQSPGIEVFQNVLYRWLKFDSSALQTVLNRYKPSRPELNYLKYLVLAVKEKPQNACMFGLGGGGVAHVLSPLLGESKLLAVESNAEVILVAKRFFLLDTLQNIDIIQQDASHFVSQYSQQFNHLLIDLFTADQFPEQCKSQEFFANCKRILKPGGILALNSANAKEHFSLFQALQNQFLNSTLTLAVPGTANLIFFAQNSKNINSFIESLKKRNKIKELAWTKPWGNVLKLRSY